MMKSNTAITVLIEAQLGQLDVTWTDHGVLYLQSPDERPGWRIREIYQVGNKSAPEEIKDYLPPLESDSKWILFWERRDTMENESGRKVLE